MADVYNPYAAPQPVETKTDQRVMIRDLWCNQDVPAGQISEHSTIDQAGTRRTTALTTTLLRTRDGRLIRDVNADPLYECRSCRRDHLHAEVMRSCDIDGTVVCRNCIVVMDRNGEVVEYCPDCYKSWKRRWLFSLS